MTIREVLQLIRKGDLAAVYLLYGEERYYARQVEQALIDAALPPDERDMGLTIFEQDPPVPQLLQAIETTPFFGGRHVVIVRDTKLFRAAKNSDADSDDKADARLLASLQDIGPDTHILLLAGEKVDKRRKLYKTVEKAGVIVELLPLKAREARDWILERFRQAQKTIAPEALTYLLTGISFMPQLSVGFLENEIDKILLHSGSRQRIDEADVKATLAGIPEVNIFAMIDAMSQKDSRLALRLLDDQLGVGEPPMRLLMLIARQVRALLYTKELAGQGSSARDIAKTLSLHPFIAEKMLGQARRFSPAGLKRILLMISDADRAIKTGRAGNVVLERIVIEMCS
ncbi:MAG: DNA polymerase III subunit delta [Sporomusaceae bacterium]|nr:DNA polymerase III subunit delta [Sporomusaceae bacterium]